MPRADTQLLVDVLQVGLNRAGRHVELSTDLRIGLAGRGEARYSLLLGGQLILASGCRSPLKADVASSAGDRQLSGDHGGPQGRPRGLAHGQRLGQQLTGTPRAPSPAE